MPLTTYVAGDVLTAASLNNNFTFAAGAGAIVQVKSTTKTDTFSASVANGAAAAVTNLSVEITPISASNKILVFATVNGSYSAAQFATVAFRLKRDSTPIAVGDAVGNRTGTTSMARAQGGDGNSRASASINHVDSPATTSAVTYSVDVQNLDVGSTITIFVNRHEIDTDVAATGRTVSSITVMEVTP